MTPLAIPVPPQLEAIVGYHGDARWFTLAWTCLGDTVVYSDGKSSGTGHGWGYLGFVRHSAVAPQLRELDLGSSEQDGNQRLVIDRQERRAFVTDAAEARTFLRSQWPPEEPLELTAEQWQEVVEEIRQRTSRRLPDMGQLMQQMKDHSALVGEMLRFLSATQAEQAGE